MTTSGRRPQTHYKERGAKTSLWRKSLIKLHIRFSQIERRPTSSNSRSRIMWATQQPETFVFYAAPDGSLAKVWLKSLIHASAKNVIVPLSRKLVFMSGELNPGQWNSRHMCPSKQWNLITQHHYCISEEFPVITFLNVLKVVEIGTGLKELHQ